MGIVTTRVPASLAALALMQSGQTASITTGRALLRQWKRRGHITRTADGYDLVEIMTYLERRSTKHQDG